ncbi:hypothetical protein [Sphingopyxis sp.]|jgi:hypothetical protein|uniref:hypothetical protein n=1 Tax=Sphingopyxis sp. TaxID=1908224 RepID=UPI003F713425
MRPGLFCLASLPGAKTAQNCATSRAIRGARAAFQRSSHGAAGKPAGAPRGSGKQKVVIHQFEAWRKIIGKRFSQIIDLRRSGAVPRLQSAPPPATRRHDEPALLW